MIYLRYISVFLSYFDRCIFLNFKGDLNRWILRKRTYEAIGNESLPRKKTRECLSTANNKALRFLL